MSHSATTDRRTLNPFDVMRGSRTLAPHDPNLNDTRWLIGESLRRAYERALLSNEACERVCGRHAWPIVIAIVIDGKGVRDCRKHVPEVVTPWRADAIITDRLRVALDAIGPVLGVTAPVKTAAE